jgi:hypothetical protein
MWLEWERAGVRSRLPLDRPLIIGRDASSDVRLPESTVSRRHAVVSLVNGQALVDATGSTNGIKLDRGRADKVALSPGQLFQIGDTTFRVVPAPEAQPAFQPVAPQAAARPPLGQPRMAPATQGQPHPAYRQAPTLVPVLPIVALGVVAVAVICAIVGIAVFRPSGALPSGEATSEPAASLPQGWSALPSAPTGQVVSGWESGTVAVRNANGELLGYASASAIPGETWASTTSSNDHYTFDAPTDWSLTHSETAGHDTFQLVPPGIDPSVPLAGGTPMIVLTWAASAPEPDPSDSTVTNLGTTDTPAPGTTVYSIGGLGRQLMAVIPVSGGVIVISGDASDTAWVDVFRHILASWRSA